MTSQTKQPDWIVKFSVLARMVRDLSNEKASAALNEFYQTLTADLQENGGTLSPTPIRPADQIQAAHDILVSIILGDCEIGAANNAKETMQVYCEVLCWILRHDHNQAFANNLKEIQRRLRERGYGSVVKVPEFD